MKKPNCHPNRKHYAIGLCSVCYHRSYSRAAYWSRSEAVKDARRAYRTEWARRKRAALKAAKGVNSPVDPVVSSKHENVEPKS